MATSKRDLGIRFAAQSSWTVFGLLTCKKTLVWQPIVADVRTVAVR